MFNVMKDIKNGALPPGEIPGFIAWAIRKSFWLFFAIIAGGAIGMLVTR